MSRLHTRSVGRGSVAFRAVVESLDARVLLSVPEPNNSFDTASNPDGTNVALVRNYSNQDSVSTASDGDDFYKFFTTNGPSHLHVNLDGMSADADLYIYNQNEQQIASSTLNGSASETVDVDLPGRQYFYVRVHAAIGATNYGLFVYNDYAGSTFGTARDLGTSLGQTNSTSSLIDGSTSDYLDYRDKVDFFKFSLEAAGSVNVRRTLAESNGGPALQTGVALYNSSGGLLRTGVVNGSGVDISSTSLNAGTYYVAVTQTSGSGQYGLRIVSDYAGATTASARDLGNVTNTSRQDTDMVGGPFGIPSYEDAMDLYKIRLDGSNGHPTSPLKLNLDLGGQDTSVFEANLFIAQDTNNDGQITTGERINTSANTGNDSITYAGLPAGTYYVGVFPTKAYTGYTLGIDSDVDQSYGNFRYMGGAPNLGTFTGTKSINGGFGGLDGDITDYYKFTVAGQTVLTATVARDAANSRETWQTALQIVKDANNNATFDNGEAIATSNTGSLTYTLPAGTYYLELGSSGGQEAYLGSLKLTPVTAAVDPDDTIDKVKTSTKNVVTTGGSVAFGFDSLKDVDLVRYVAKAGETIGFDIDGRNNTSPDTYLRLFKSDGTQLASNNDGFAVGEFGTFKSSYLKYTFATAGTYYLGVSLNPNTAYSATTGNGDVSGTGPIGDYTLLASKLGKIGGTVFKDTDGDGVKDSGESGLSGVTLYLDYDNDGVKDTDEISVTTDSSGNYAFTGIPAGTWKVRQVLPGGYAQTSPSGNGGQSVTLTAGQSVSGKNFGDKPGAANNTASIAGRVFYDPNGNGKQDSGESNYSGVVVYLDADNDGVLDSSETRTTTDGSGNYKFSALSAGTYKVRAVPPTQFHQTAPANGYGQSVTLTSGQAATGKNFGEQINPG